MFYFKAAIDEVVWGKDARDPDKKLEVWQSMTSGLLASCPGMCVFWLWCTWVGWSVMIWLWACAPACFFASMAIAHHTR